jgi:hypothetical protein
MPIEIKALHIKAEIHAQGKSQEPARMQEAAALEQLKQELKRELLQELRQQWREITTER